MKTNLFSTLAVTTLLLVSCHNNDNNMKPNEQQIEQFAQGITWLTNSAIKVTHNKLNIFIDPYNIANPDTAHLILITHGHHDHFSPSDIEKIATDSTTIVCTSDVSPTVKELGFSNVITIKPFESITWNNIEISTVPMYNIVKDNRHNKANGWVGYLLNINGITLYHAGDTERIPEMKNINCDIAMLPLGQTYTMNSVNEAAEATMDTHARFAIPMHYDRFEGKAEDAQEFAQLLNGKVKVLIKNPLY